MVLFGGMNWDPFASPMALLVTLFLFVCGIAAILMPLYVIAMHAHVKEMRRLNKQMDEKLHELVWYAKERHQRGE